VIERTLPVKIYVARRGNPAGRAAIELRMATTATPPVRWAGRSTGALRRPAALSRSPCQCVTAPLALTGLARGSLRLAHTVTVSLASVAARLGVTGTPIFRPPMVKTRHELRLEVDPLRLPPLSRQRRASDPDASMCQLEADQLEAQGAECPLCAPGPLAGSHGARTMTGHCGTGL
jgi:ribosomal protein S27AE